MRTRTDIQEMIETLQEVWDLAPDLRFGQLIVAVMSGTAEELFCIEDEELAARMQMFIRDRYESVMIDEEDVDEYDESDYRPEDN